MKRFMLLIVVFVTGCQSNEDKVVDLAKEQLLERLKYPASSKFVTEDVSKFSFAKDGDTSLSLMCLELFVENDTLVKISEALKGSSNPESKKLYDDAVSLAKEGIKINYEMGRVDFYYIYGEVDIANALNALKRSKYGGCYKIDNGEIEGEVIFAG